MDELLKERLELACGRVEEVARERSAAEPFGEYFRQMAGFLLEMITLREELQRKTEENGRTLKELRERNHRLYQDILPEHYAFSWGNPAYAAAKLGRDMGQLLSFLYTELRGMIVFAYEGRDWDFLVCLELFLQIYGEFEDGTVPEREQVRQVLYWYVNDYCADMAEYRIREQLDPRLDFAARIIMDEDLTDLRYLYRFGEYVTEDEERTAAFLNTLSEEEIRSMASTYTEGYRIGFQVTGKDISKKKTVNIRYCLGFERMIREAVRQFAAMGLKPVIYRSAVHAVNRRQHLRIGYYGAIPNQQFEYDHRNDAGLFLDEDFVGRKLRCIRNSYEKMKELAAVHGGPAVVEIFGETPFAPASCEDAIALDEKQQKLQVHLNNETGQITNRYIRGEERSFTIIAYPTPQIGEQFEDIFRETVKINTLDYNLYQRIQQRIIDALDQGVKVQIRGRGENRTDMTVMLHTLTDPARQTNFENCVADVNIPVGEVFTSPQLAGTCGTLHVTGVFLEGLHYRDLWMNFEEGKITGYGCGNFEDPRDGRAYILENILAHHPTLPLGEFAIGTNTTAYRMAKTYGIGDRLPILIAEKMGPHFAVGDTCYSWAEDTAVFNPDGKEIIARDNEISLNRKEDPAKAYFGCHTDITIPYEELAYIRAVRKDGSEISIIENGRFVLPGTEELNRPLED